MIQKFSKAEENVMSRETTYRSAGAEAEVEPLL